MNEKKIQRLRFDNLSGETSLQRLMTLLRRKNIRNLAMFTVLILLFCVEIFFLYYIAQQYEDADGFLIVMVIFSVMGLIYGPLLLWLILLVFRPDKCYCMRRLRRLGDLEAIAGKLEEDLAAEGGILLEKGCVYVTRRFILEANLFYYRVYPLEGLRDFKGRKVIPTFYYGNGISIKMVRMVPFHITSPYIVVEEAVNEGTEKLKSAVHMKTKKPKPGKRDMLDLVVFLCIAGALFTRSCFVWGIRTVAIFCSGLLLLVLAAALLSGLFEPDETGMNTETGKPENRKRDTIVGFAMFFIITGALFYLLYFNKLSVWGTLAVAVCSGSALAWVLAEVVLGTMKNLRIARMLSEIKDPQERICKMEELCAEGWYKNRVLYLNALSTVYYDKQDTEKALELVREACRIQSGKRESGTGLGITVSEMLELNKIIYLTALERYDEAEPLLAPLDDKRYNKNSVAQYLIHATRAQLAIEKGDRAAAREYLSRVRGLSYKGLTEERRINISCHLILLEAECDLLEQDMASALTKLDDVLARSTWQPSIKRAAKLKERARRKSNGLRRRRHVFRPGSEHMAAQRQARRRT